MKKLLVFFFLITTLSSIAQTYQKNLEKYWYYRHRLKTKFMDISGDGSSDGNYIPAENRSDTIIEVINGDDFEQHYIRWGDSPWLMGHYIIVLSLEYSLLKHNGQDYSETLYELNQVLNTYDRLDDKAETCFWSDEEWNGFFIRDDVSDLNADAFPSNYPDNNPNLDLASSYKDNCQQTDKGVISQDQAIAFLMGLRFAKQLVDDDWIQQKVNWIANAIVSRMHEYRAPFKWWRIRNPVTDEIVPDGGKFINLVGFCWATAESAGKITNENEHYGYSSWNLVKAIFDFFQKEILFNFSHVPIVYPSSITINGIGYSSISIDGHPFNAYMIAELSLMSNEWAPPENNIYDWLVRLYNDTKGKYGMPYEVGLYPHFPLLAEILYGYSGSNRWPSTLIESNFLNTAPQCGSYSYRYFKNGDTIDISSNPPWHSMSLLNPDHPDYDSEGGGWHEDGEYNMIDYMILYNAYFMNYLIGDHVPYQLDKATYPVQDFDIIWDINGYPDTIWLDTYHYTCSDPQTLYASRQIDTKAIVGYDGGVNYVAGSSIKFLPGFKVNNGGCLNTTINPSMLQDIYYHKTNINTCSGGSFKPLVIMDNNNYHKISLSQKKYSDKKAMFYHINQRSLKNGTNSSNTITTDFNHAAGIHNKISNTSDFVYPNPSNGKFTLNSTKTIKSLYIHNSIGELVLNKENINRNSVIFDIGKYNKGVYYLKVVGYNGIKTYKLIKF